MITLKDRGSAIRVYCYVADTIDMILKLMNTKHFEPLNIGGIHKLSIYQLASMVGEQAGVEVKKK